MIQTQTAATLRWKVCEMVQRNDLSPPVERVILPDLSYEEAKQEWTERKKWHTGKNSAGCHSYLMMRPL